MASSETGARISVVHLSGPHEGRIDEVVDLPATIGGDPKSSIMVTGVASTHALLVRHGDEVVLEDADSGRETLLLGESIRRAPLRDGDVIELGSGGPRLRFRREGGPAPPPPRVPASVALSGTSGIFREVVKEATARTSRGFRVAVTLVAVAAAVAVGWSQWQARKLRSELADLHDAVAASRAEQQQFLLRIDEERRRASEERQGFESQIAEARQREEDLNQKLRDVRVNDAREVRSELVATRERLLALESERAAGERIIRDYGAGVCLIQGRYGFKDAEGRNLRLTLDENGNPKRKDDGSLVLDVRASGPPYTSEYFGTGFLVHGKGLVLTNRHVAEPWWNDAFAQAMAEAGFKPRFLAFRAFFPRETEPFDLVIDRISDRVDLALVRFAPPKRRIPVLLLDVTGKGAVPGQPVVVLGYPAGIEALLAKADGAVVKEIVSQSGTSSERMAANLGRRGLIRPSTTQGHIGDVTNTDVVFDAATTQGGSGGPVVNTSGRVIAVEYAVLTKFEGTSFGVPVGFALDLLRPPRRKPGG